MLNSILKIILKIFNKKKYLEIKESEKNKKKLFFYNKNIKNKLEEIDSYLKKKKKLSFLHSGHCGDLIYSLSLIKELSKKYECNLFVQLNKKNELYYHNHPAGDVMINNRMGEQLLPLLKKQKYLNSINIFENQNIEIDLNLFREVPTNLYTHSIRWYSHLTGVPVDMEEIFLDVEEHESIKNKIVILRSPRYQNQFINFDFLKKKENLIFIGLKLEYDNLKQQLPHLNFYNCKNFLEMAQIIKSSKLFIGNMSLGFAIAEGLKVPRLLEACPDFPVVFPVGKNAYDFYHQIHFEKYFQILDQKF